MRDLLALVLALLCAILAACGWDPSRPFDREAPAVRQAVADLDGGDAGSAANKLEDYLSTGPCKDGSTSARLTFCSGGRTGPRSGLSSFRLGEQLMLPPPSARRRSTPERTKLHTGAASCADRVRAARPGCCSRRPTRRALRAARRAPATWRATSPFLSRRRLRGGRSRPMTARALVLGCRRASPTPEIPWGATRPGTEPSRCGESRTRRTRVRTPPRTQRPTAGRTRDATPAGMLRTIPEGTRAVRRRRAPTEAATVRRPRRSPPTGGSEPDSGGAPPPASTSEDERMLDQPEERSHAPAGRGQARRQEARPRHGRQMKRAPVAVLRARRGPGLRVVVLGLALSVAVPSSAWAQPSVQLQACRRTRRHRRGGGHVVHLELTRAERRR